MRAYVIYPEILNLEEDSKRTEWYIVACCWWIMTCVLLLRQLDWDFGNRHIRKRLRFCAFSQRICQGNDGSALSALCIIADCYFHAS